MRSLTWWKLGMPGAVAAVGCAIAHDAARTRIMLSLCGYFTEGGPSIDWTLGIRRRFRFKTSRRQAPRGGRRGPNGPAPLDQQGAQAIGAFRAAQFAQRTQFDLADTLAGDGQTFADLLEGMLAAAT